MSFISVPTLYSYVPTCPACGSPRTGRYVRMTPFTEEYTQLEALRYGEIIQPAGERKHLEGELFCVTCGNIWRGKTEKRRLSPFELAREKELREIGYHILSGTVIFQHTDCQIVTSRLISLRDLFYIRHTGFVNAALPVLK